MTTDDALIRLGRSAAESVCGVLETFLPGDVAVGDVAMVAAGKHPLEGIPVPAVVAMASYVDGAAGGHVVVMTVEGARRLAAAMMGTKPDTTGATLSQPELSAVTETLSQMLGAAARATGAALGADVQLGVPETRTFDSAEDAIAACASAPHATCAVLTLRGEPCRLVQLAPNALVARMTRALDERGAEPVVDAGHDGSPSLAGISVRVCAELGRARMPSAQIVGLPAGAVVELDRQADEPIDVYVNGRRFATGRLMVVDGTDWAVRIETILDQRSRPI